VCEYSTRQESVSLAERNRNWTGTHVRLSVRGPNKTGDPDFLYGAPDTTAWAAFSKESRMKFANATKFHRKSGEKPTIALNYPSS